MMSQRVFAWRNAIRGAARASNPGAARCVSPGASPARCVGGGGRHVGTSRASNARAPWTAIVSPRSQRSHRRGACASAGAARGDAAERITSTDNATVKHFAKLVKNRAHRVQSGSVVVAGASLLEEIYGAPDGADLPEVKAMFLADDAPVPRGVPARRVVRAPEHVLKKAAGLRSVDRVDAVAELAAPNLDGAAALGTTDATRLLALDGIQDPGNLGTLVRTALALGWDAVALLPGTCDPFNDKARPLRFPVSRSPRTRARTARFSRLLPMMSSPKSHEHCHAARLGSRPVAPRSSSSFRVLDESQPPRPSLSALRARDAERAGRGGHLSPAPTTSFCQTHHDTTWFRPTITPRRGFAQPITNVEPNVRADLEPVPSSFVSVLVAQALRAARGGMFRLPMARLTWSELEAATDERRLRRFCAEPTAEDAVDATATRGWVGGGGEGDDVGLCLVLGSEGQGLSADALRICRPVAIPMPGEMESLNVGVAGGILMYLMRR